MDSHSGSQNGLWAASFGAVGTSLKALEDAGVTDAHLKAIRQDPHFVKRLGNFWVDEWKALCDGTRMLKESIAKGIKHEDGEVYGFFDPGISLQNLITLSFLQDMKLFSEHMFSDTTSDCLKWVRQPAQRRIRIPIPNSMGRENFDDFLLKDEEIPSIRDAVMFLVVHFLVTQERLLDDQWVICEEDRRRYIVGRFNADQGMTIIRSWEGSGTVGLAGIR